jgi:tetratricopeptide (TPR) repeat protein
MPAVDPKAAVDALRRRYEESVAHARGRQAHLHVQAAEAAAAKGDFIEAARLYRVAQESSSDPSLRAVAAQTEVKAKEQMVSSSIAKAKEAEKRQEFAEAGAYWARAYDSAPQAEIANRAAMCFRRAGSDPRRAAKFGEEAVKADPSNVTYRVTLALVYADAGLLLRARGELERAQALDPKSPVVKEAAARLKGVV